MVSDGVVSPSSSAFLRSGWGVLDFILVSLGWLPHIINGARFAKALLAFRAFRILRALRSIRGLPGLRTLVGAIGTALPSLGSVMLLYLLFFAVFGVFASDLWAGALRWGCVDEIDRFYGGERCFNGRFGLGKGCPSGQVCAEVGNVRGMFSFDNFGVTVVSLLTTVTLEGWSDVMDSLVEVFATQWIFLYFLAATIFGGFFVVNLALAILCESFSRTAEVFEEAKAKPVTPAWKTFANAATVLSANRAQQQQQQQQQQQERGAEMEMEVSTPTPAPAPAPAPAISSPSASTSTSPPTPAPAPSPAPASGDQLSAWRQRLLALSVSGWFQGAVMAVIILNTVVLSLEHYRMSPTLGEFIFIANSCFSVIFLLELIVRLLALGPRLFFTSDAFNTFDTLVVIFSFVELIFLDSGGGRSGGNFSALRAFRTLRVLKLARLWPGLRRLVEAALGAASLLGNCLLLFALVLLIAGVVGSQFFGGSGGARPPVTANFESLFWSCTTAFIIMSSESWPDTLESVVNATSWLASFYVIAVLLTGSFIVLTLLQVVLIEKFVKNALGSLHDDDYGAEAEVEMRPMLSDSADSTDLRSAAALSGVGPSPGLRRKGRAATLAVTVASGMARRPTTAAAAATATATAAPSQQVLPSSMTPPGSPTSPSSPPPSSARHVDSGAAAVAAARAEADKIPDPVLRAKKRKAATRGLAVRHLSVVMPTHSSLFVFKPTNRLRLVLLSAVESRAFEIGVIVAVLFSCALLLLDYPAFHRDHVAGTRVVEALDDVVVALFAAEAAVKIVAMGFCLDRGSYLRSSLWNRLDFVIVVVTLLDKAVPGLKVIRAGRALRPLRLVSKSLGMKVAIKSLVKALPGVAQVLLIFIFFLFVFAIVGVQLFAGFGYQCTAELFSTEAACLLAGHRWVPSQWRFDNVALAMLVLFEVSTGEGWPATMDVFLSSGGAGQGPRPDGRRAPGPAVYFCVFLFVVSYLTLGLLIAVVVDNFKSVTGQYDGSALLTQDQRDWLAIQRVMLKNQPPRRLVCAADAEPSASSPSSSRLAGASRLAFRVITHRSFEHVVAVIIALNTVSMTAVYWGASPQYTQALYWLDVAFLICYVVEAALRVLALGPRQFWADGWNRLGLFVIATSVLALSVPGLRLIRSLRVLRILPVAKSVRSLSYLLLSLRSSLPVMANVGSVVAILFFIYAIAAVALFSGLERGEVLNQYSNFETPFRAMILLFRCVTGESWNLVMHELIRQTGSYWPVPFFISFTLVLHFVLTNLLVAVVLESFDDIHSTAASKSPTGRGVVRPDHFVAFNECWLRHDRLRSHYLRTDQIERFLLDLPPPLGLKGSTSAAAWRVLFDLNLPVFAKGVFYKDLLMSLSARALGIARGLPDEPSVETVSMQRVASAWNSSSLNRPKEDDSRECFSVNVLYAALKLQRAWRARSKAARSLRTRKRAQTKALPPTGRRSLFQRMRDSVTGRQSVANRE